VFSVNLFREGVCLLNLVNSIKHFFRRNFTCIFCERSYQYLKNYVITYLIKLKNFFIFLKSSRYNLFVSDYKGKWVKRGDCFWKRIQRIREQQKRNLMSWVSFYTSIQINAVSHSCTLSSYTDCLETLSFSCLNFHT
jgi:hypothetical protein